MIWAGLAYFVIRLLPFPFPLLAAPVEVILLVCINSPIYDCRNLFPPSSFSCSERTISTRSTISSKLAWRALDCSINASRASWPIFSISSLLLRGLIVLASPSSYSSSFNSTCGLSRGIMMVPLDFRLPSFGLWSLVVSGLAPSSLTEPEEDEELMSSLSEADEGHTAGSATVGKPDEATCCMDMAGRQGNRRPSSVDSSCEMEVGAPEGLESGLCQGVGAGSGRRAKQLTSGP